MIATAARLGSDLSSAELARAQQAREAELAVMLGALLRRARINGQLQRRRGRRASGDGSRGRREQQGSELHG